MSAEGQIAVTRMLARIMTERHTGTHWSPVEAAELDAKAGSGEPLRRLSAPPPPPPSPEERSP